jgi:hypothetical protein
MTSTAGKLDNQPWISAAIEDLRGLKAINLPAEDGDEPAKEVLFTVVEDQLLAWAKDSPLRLPKPFIEIASDGDICLTWRLGPRKRLDVEFDNQVIGQLRGGLLLDDTEMTVRSPCDVPLFLKELAA